ncbi:dihydroxyacetone kinase subunit L [Acidisoma silvae]|uniref:Dihydroxyacetone kinase subunit L n=2 Tax=Acidisoma silvae TaxID=2802396 RepID=A0A963YQE5_9PROT|nr:dihydroxyacetone kinase subunit L [Acidisoma silvae]
MFDLADIIVREQGKLSEIDGQTGDGDHGVNMGKGFRIAGERLRALPSFTLPEGLALLGDTLLSDIGGSMGPLYGTFFTDMSEVLDGKDSLDAADFSAMLAAGLAAVQGLGEAKPGDKTLVDVIVPASQAFNAAVAEGKSFTEALEALQTAAAAGLEATRDMVAKVGRASRLGERSRGTLDAGAASCDMILETLAAGLIKQLAT